jgi:predicted SnoaL-like aldol condensation-catalyzing enzyme
MGSAAPASAGNGQTPTLALQTRMEITAPAGPQVSDEQLKRNQQLVRTFYEHFFTDGHADMLDDILAEDFVDHGEALFGGPDGHAKRDGGIAYMGQAVPMKVVRIDDIVAEGDMVGVRVVMTGVHSTDWLGKPATGNELNWNDLSVFRIKDGKIVERFFNSDSLYILEQLGYWPVNK